MPWRVITGAAAAMAVALWVLWLWLPGMLAPSSPARVAEGPVSAPGTDATTRRIHASLFYVSATGDTLIGVDREVPYAAAPADQARAIVDAQLAAAPSGYVSAIPAGVSVRALFLTARGEAFVDLSDAVRTGHPGGSLAETLTVYTIVHALTMNLPDITRVQILVEGHEVDSLAGHVDLRHPLAPDRRIGESGSGNRDR